METIIFLVLSIVAFWLLFCPALIAYRIGEHIKSPDWREVRDALLGTAFASPIFLLISFSKHTHHPGSADGDFLGLRSLGYAIRNFGVSVAYIWAGTVACAVVSLLVALTVRWLRRRRAPQISAQPSPVERGEYEICPARIPDWPKPLQP